MKPIKDIIKQFEQRESSRSQFEGMWQDIIDHILPRRSPVIYDETQGTERTGKIYDGTPPRALLRLAAILNSMLTNRQIEWFELETTDEDLNTMPNTKAWLEHDATILRKSLDNSNFYSQAHEGYIDLAGLGQFVTYIEEYATPDKDLYFSTRHVRECFMSEGDQGRMDSIDLLRNMTVYQIMDRWSKAKITGAIPEKIRKDFDKGEIDNRYNILQSVYPNDDTVANSLNPLEYPYQACWLWPDEEKEIHRSGYHEFPFSICHWVKASGEDYGRGPGWDALPDIKILYAMRKTTIRVAEKIADPPIQMPSRGYLGRVQLQPGGLNFYDAAAQGRIEPIELGRNFPVTLEMIQDQRNLILDHFLNNQLQLIDTKEMTAEEARLRVAENARVIGPTFGRLNDDFLEPLIARCMGILRRAGKLAPIPPEVIEAARRRGIQLRVRFVSPLAKAQTADDVQAIQRTAATGITWARESQNPTVLDNLDFDIGIRKIAELDGTPATFVRAEDQVLQIRKARADELKRQQQIAAAESAGRTVKDVAGAVPALKAIEGGAA
jgi:hypothetical protein